ncbi:hypothetical protein BpHYR1_012329 [Brachionus plicatilis]|uniref:Uncharacterized protein n=1 Tax=Brachionus plicatilis TaxID=10195 RepID=A0A3M7RQ20_BRAPC|nr:hypothetical protein BpHYR1_012329 [Brachionus plicatilis]
MISKFLIFFSYVPNHDHKLVLLQNKNGKMKIIIFIFSLKNLKNFMLKYRDKKINLLINLRQKNCQNNLRNDTKFKKRTFSNKI